MEDKPQVHVFPSENNLTILNGEADVVNKEPFVITGDIFAPNSYAKQHLELNKGERNVLYVDREKGFVHLHTAVGTSLHSKVRGSLDYTDDFQSLRINGEPFTRKDLSMLCRKRPYLFKSPTAKYFHSSLINFEVKVEKSTKATDDRHGNMSLFFDSVAKDANVPMHISFLVEPFVGIPDPVEIIVDVEIEPTGSDIEFFLVSENAITMLREKTKEYVDKAIGDTTFWSDNKVPIINVG